MHGSYTCRLAALGLLAGLAACGSGDDSGGRISTAEREGAVVVRQTGSPRFESELFGYEEVVELVQDESVPASLLYRPSAFSRSDDGSFAVADDARIVVYDANGRYVRHMGRAGAGPGDFQSPVLLGIHDGAIRVMDASLFRLTLYGIDGDLLGTHQTPRAFGSARQLHPLPDGALIAADYTASQIEFSGARFVVFDSSGDSLAGYSTPEIRTSVVIEKWTGRPNPYQIPYSAEPVALVVPGRGVLVSTGAEPVLRWFSMAGTPTRTIALEGLPNEMTAEDRRRFEEWADGLSARATNTESVRSGIRQDIAALRDAMGDSKPYWTFVAVDDAGFHWLRIPEQVTPWLSGNQTYRYHLLTPDGEYLGITSTPPQKAQMDPIQFALPVSVRRGHLMSIAVDPETGGDRLRAYRLSPLPDGFRYPG